jgi:hypothetical protein
MKPTKTLVERLRRMKGLCERSVSQASADFFTEAADRLEELERENAELKTLLAAKREKVIQMQEAAEFGGWLE